MREDQAWKNFDLGKELHIAGAFVYDGLRSLRRMDTLDRTDQVFQVLYNLAVGVERVLKVAVVLLEHRPASDPTDLEDSLRTHSHQELLARVRARVTMTLAGPHNEFMALLGEFYKSHRYHRFMMSSAWTPDRELTRFRDFLRRRLGEPADPPQPLVATPNTDRAKRFITRLATKICQALYDVVRDQAGRLNLYTYELRHGSKAQSVFVGTGRAFQSDELLAKELLVYFMNTTDRTGLLDLLRSIDPLPFDPALIPEYLPFLGVTNTASDEDAEETLEALYDDLGDRRDRLDTMRLIGDRRVDLDASHSDDE